MAAPAPARARAHLWVSGRVQGVGFRFFVQRRAQALGLGGFVRNLRDGRVEVVVEGPEDAVRQVLEVVRAGPPGATVNRVELAWEASRDDTRFVIRTDADA